MLQVAPTLGELWRCLEASGVTAVLGPVPSEDPAGLGGSCACPGFVSSLCLAFLSSPSPPQAPAPCPISLPLFFEDKQGVGYSGLLPVCFWRTWCG